MCLVVRSNWIGTGSTQLDPHFVESLDVLDPTRIGIFSSDAGWIGPSKMRDHLDPLPLRHGGVFLCSSSACSGYGGATSSGCGGAGVVVVRGRPSSTAAVRRKEER
jgi:hypothetical protein